MGMPRGANCQLRAGANFENLADSKSFIFEKMLVPPLKTWQIQKVSVGAKVFVPTLRTWQIPKTRYKISVGAKMLMPIPKWQIPGTPGAK